MSCCVLYNRGYCQWTFHIAEIGIADHFCSCDLDLDPMTFTCELDLYLLEISYIRYAKMNSYIKAFESYRITDSHTYALEII